MTNEEIANRFQRLSRLMTIRGDEPFRTRAYARAADAIRDWGVPLSQIAERDGTKGLQEIPGVGEAISGKIIELLTRGTFEAWERVIAETPETTLEILRVDGINIKIATELYTRFRVSSIADLKSFVEGGGLEMIDGVGERIMARIKRGIAD
ncbi:MAG: hypothetical protein MSG64_07325 [Pyrinomonadaceae bacterium MAG19_C2-C3]|nr:hypothetical protein [Pyrinomonadaceae bacterium MAG19_C2-C3]